MTTWNFKIEKAFKRDYLITRWRKKKYLLSSKSIEIKQQFRGDCTVWYSYPECKRCSTHLESWLCDIWKKCKWEEENENK